MSTVILLHPLGPNIPRNILRGEHTGASNNVVVPDYPHTGAPNILNAEAGMDALDAALHNNSPPFEIIGWSMGGQVAAGWDRRDPDIDPADITRIITLGNPERKYNGVSVLRPTEFPAVYGGLGFRDATPYTVIEFARQYDFFADHPDDYTDPTAALNALLGFGVHADYTGVGINDVGNTSYTESNRTYMLSPTFPCPIVNLNWFAWVPSVRDDEDATKRPVIEACYSRPGSLSTIPDPAPARTASTVIDLTAPDTAPPLVSSTVGSFPVTTTKTHQQIKRPTVNPYRVGMWPWHLP